MCMYYKFQKHIFKSEQDLECSCIIIFKKTPTKSTDISLREICYFFQITDPSCVSVETRFLWGFFRVPSSTIKLHWCLLFSLNCANWWMGHNSETAWQYFLQDKKAKRKNGDFFCGEVIILDIVFSTCKCPVMPSIWITCFCFSSLNLVLALLNMKFLTPGGSNLALLLFASSLSGWG